MLALHLFFTPGDQQKLSTKINRNRDETRSIPLSPEASFSKLEEEEEEEDDARDEELLDDTSKFCISLVANFSVTLKSGPWREETGLARTS